MTESPPDLRPQRYRLMEPLGAGGQGRTFRAIDLRNGRAVAVKVIQLGEAGWKRFELFEREGQVLRSLEHPAIPRYLDTFAIEEEGRYCLVMELCEGRSLHDLVRQGQVFGEAQIWNILHQALEVLEYLHGRRPPIIHRDIKPANLIQKPDGSLALVDFGGVRVALRPDGGSTVVGSFGYLAPEQLHGEATPATDLYGLGATLAALATGTEADKLPRRGLRVDLNALMEPCLLRDLLSRLLEPDPTQRLTSVAAVRELLSGRAEPAPAPASPELDEPPNQGAALLIRLIGTFGYVGLTLLEAILLPVVYLVLSHVWSRHPRKVRELQVRRHQVLGALHSGRQAMKRLARGSRRQRPRLPPGRPGPPGLPEHGGPRRRRGWRR